MSEFVLSMLSKITPVTDTSKKTIDNITVILFFFLTPLLTIPLYQFQWVIIWNMALTRNNMLAIRWSTARSCHKSWLFPCPAICSPIPEYAVRINNGIIVQFVVKIRFIVLFFDWLVFFFFHGLNIDIATIQPKPTIWIIPATATW